MCVLLDQSCPTLCSPTDCSPTGSSVHGVLQARILEWAAISYSRGSSQTGDQTRISLLHWQAGSLPVHHLGSPTPRQVWLAFGKLGGIRILHTLYSHEIRMQSSEIDCNRSIGYKKIIAKVEKIKRKENYFFREKGM